MVPILVVVAGSVVSCLVVSAATGRASLRCLRRGERMGWMLGKMVSLSSVGATRPNAGVAALVKRRLRHCRHHRLPT